MFLVAVVVALPPADVRRGGRDGWEAKGEAGEAETVRGQLRFGVALAP
jgi:hypothetical protein